MQDAATDLSPVEWHSGALCVRFWDSGDGNLWIYRDASGLVGVVRAQTFEAA